LTADTNGIISQFNSFSVNPYKEIQTPMLSMQHRIDVADNPIGQDMITTTARQYDMLSYLQSKGFVGENFQECMDSIRGTRTPNKPVYCLTFDDMQFRIWRDERIRNIFNQFRAKPTLVYLFDTVDYEGNTPPDYALTKEEYIAAKSCGWDIISHGFCMYNDKLSYAQFIWGFEKTKEKWLQWYGESLNCYNAHGSEITDYQFYLLKHLGFNSIASGVAKLGWFCECGTTIDVQYKRVVFMDSELSWDTVKQDIDEWID
jgi:hypothetical protein